MPAWLDALRRRERSTILVVTTDKAASRKVRDELEAGGHYVIDCLAMMAAGAVRTFRLDAVALLAGVPPDAARTVVAGFRQQLRTRVEVERVEVAGEGVLVRQLA